MNSSEPLERLSECLGRLPTVGRRSAEKMAIRLVREGDGLLRDLIEALEDVRKNVRCCSLCGSVTAADRNPCGLCTSPGRDDEVLCVVEEPADIMMIERSGGFRGRYHALMGKISPMRGDGPGDVRIGALVERVRGGRFKEVVLALSTDVEGDSTCSYIGDLLRGTGVRVTRPAYGLPAGSGIGYSDPVTLERAMRGRQGL